MVRPYSAAQPEQLPLLVGNIIDAAAHSPTIKCRLRLAATPGRWAQPSKLFLRISQKTSFRAAAASQAPGIAPESGVSPALVILVRLNFQRCNSTNLLDALTLVAPNENLVESLEKDSI